MLYVETVIRPNRHLPHAAEELQSPPPPDAVNDEVASENAERRIRAIVNVETGESPRHPRKDGGTAHRPRSGAVRPADTGQPPPRRPAHASQETRLRTAMTMAGRAGNSTLTDRMPHHQTGESHWRRFARTFPALAERLRRSADHAAEKFDTLLDFLPEKWAERLSPPDLSTPVTVHGDAADPKPGHGPG